MATSLQAPWVRLHQNMPPTLSRSVTPPPHLPYHNSECGQHLPKSTLSSPGRTNPTCLSSEVLQLQGKVNMALEWLFATKATLNFHQRELVQNVKISTCWNEAQTTEAIKEAEIWCAAVICRAETCYEVMVKEVEACCTTQAQALEQSHEESMLKLEHEALAEEGCDCWAFVEACSTAL